MCDGSLCLDQVTAPPPVAYKTADASTPKSKTTATFSRRPHTVALISLTSGTTGIPKAIPRTHAFLMAQWKAVAPLLHSETEEIDLVTFPVFVLINLAEGRTPVLPNWKMSKLATLDPSALIAWISTNKCTLALRKVGRGERRRIAQTDIHGRRACVSRRYSRLAAHL